MKPKTKVALVDDHVLIRSGIAGIVNSLDNYEVAIEADNGKMFIEALSTSTEVELVLLDINMPVMDGYQTAQWIQKNAPQLKVLVLSMMDKDFAIIRMMKSGARGFILKDSRPAELEKALDAILYSGFHINEVVSNKMIHHFSHSNAAADGLPHLTERELEFLKFACTELSHKQIAHEMSISPRTVDTYRDSLFEKLGVTSRVGLALYAIRAGIVEL